MFKAPDWSESFYDDICAKSETYINSGYWDDIEIRHLRNWLTNFNNKEEKYFAACILDSLIYRSKRMVNSSIDEIAITRIPSFLKEKKIEDVCCIKSWLTRLRQGGDIPFRIIAIEDVDQRAGKSGAVLSRRVDERLHLARHLTQKLENFDRLHQNVQAIVLIDDFAGTGEQFVSFMDKLSEKQSFDKYQYLYVPLAACKGAINFIQASFPNVVVEPVEILSEEDGLFYPINGYFQGDKVNSIEAAKEFYLDLCAHRGFGDTSFLLGKGDLSLTFGFDFSTPNNNLKLLYHNPNDNSWKNLLVRRQ